MKAPAWLSHLCTDRYGRPVPYINLWGAEDTNRLSIRHDPHVGMPGLYLDDLSETEPDFFRQNMQRQRECMAAGLCQVCARPVPWSRRFLVRPVTVVTEPWLDHRCAQFAIDKCPGLIRRTNADDLTLIPITSQRQTKLTISRGWVEGPCEEESRRVQPAMWAKVLLTDVAIKVPA